MPLSTIMAVVTPSGSAPALVQSTLNLSSAPSGSSSSNTHALVHVHSIGAASAFANVNNNNNNSSSSSSSVSSSNPVSALIAGRTTVVAPPSLSTVNHSDTHAGNRARERVQRLAGRTSQLSVRPDLQQNVSPPTAAVPVYTRENISTSQGWSIPPPHAALHKPPPQPPMGPGPEATGEFTVHHSFCKTAEQRGDVLVRVEGVEFYVHKHVLMFSSPFFASLLEGEWRELQLAAYMATSASFSQGHTDALDDVEQLPRSDTDDELEVLADEHADADKDGADTNEDESQEEQSEQLAGVKDDARAARRADEPSTWPSEEEDRGETGVRSDENDVGHGSEQALVSPPSGESGADSMRGDNDDDDVIEAPVRSSTVRASFYTAEYHFEDATDVLSDGTSETAAEAGTNPTSEETRQVRIDDARRALEGNITAPEALESVANDRLGELSGTVSPEAVGTVNSTGSRASLQATASDSRQGCDPVRQSRRRIASLDSCQRGPAHLRKHKPKARSIDLHRKASKKFGEDLATRAMPTRKSSKSFDLAVMSKGAAAADQKHGSEPVSPLARFESLATPPGSPAPRSSTGSGAGSGCPHTAEARSRASSQDPLMLLRKKPRSQQRIAENRSRRQTRSQQRGGSSGLIAVVDLEEETATTFQSFLFHIYPHLDLHVTWYNCGPLLRFADKFQVPYMRRSCIDFLKAALPGRSIEAMRIAEQHQLPEQYREASRHVLDNYSEWYPEELEVLSKETLLKLERKRTWFLERMLKLGLCSPARDYECHAHCPDPQSCARLLQDKWQAAYANTFRFSPPQPSAIFRHLRDLDGAPFLAMSACQSTAKAWVRLLFDRMFSLDTIHTPRQFLFVRLEAQTPARGGGGGGVNKEV